MAKSQTVRGPYVIDELLPKSSGRRWWYVYQRFDFLEGVWHTLRTLARDDTKYRNSKPKERAKIWIDFTSPDDTKHGLTISRTFRWRAQRRA